MIDRKEMAYQLFIKWLIALLTGSGVVIIAMTNIALGGKVTPEVKILMYYSIWWFILSLVTAFISGLCLITAYFSHDKIENADAQVGETDNNRTMKAWYTSANFFFYISAIFFAIGVLTPLISFLIYDYF